MKPITRLAQAPLLMHRALDYFCDYPEAKVMIIQLDGLRLSLHTWRMIWYQFKSLAEVDGPERWQELLAKHAFRVIVNSRGQMTIRREYKRQRTTAAILRENLPPD